MPSGQMIGEGFKKAIKKTPGMLNWVVKIGFLLGVALIVGGFVAVKALGG